MRVWRAAGLALVLLTGARMAAAAPIVIGGSALLDESGATQLEAWLGAGPLQLTNIFAKARGDGQTSLDFHAAADGLGPTFSVLAGRFGGGPAEIIGGYNPYGWHSNNTRYFSSSEEDKAAFLFNLTAAVRQDQVDAVQTWNYTFYGPTFGANHDLAVFSDLESGMAYQDAYGPAGLFGQNIIGPPGFNPQGFQIDAIELFTIAAVEAAPVPEPASLLLVGSALAGAAVRRFRRRSR